jgi:hypothetical protein
VLVEDARLIGEQRDVARAGTAGDRLAHLADHLVVDQSQYLRPERRLGDVGVDIDQEVVFVALRLPRRMREDVARVGLHGDFLQFAELLRRALEHGLGSLEMTPVVAGRRPPTLRQPAALANSLLRRRLQDVSPNTR